jgi:hypothetical protein
LEPDLQVAQKKGLFQVSVDSKPVITRQGGLFAMLTRKPWPSLDDVVTAIRGAGN